MKNNATKTKNQTSSQLVNQTSQNFNKVSTTERQWKVLSMINRGKWIGTIYIQEQLRLAGFSVTLRTVQRDLVALSERFLIEHNNSNPQGWRWRDDAPLQSMPNMNLSQAVAFRMMEENLTQLLPPAVLKELRPWFDLAERQLSEGNSMQSWLKKVHIEPPTQNLIPPDINIDVQNDIYQAIFEQKQISATYKKINAKQNAEYVLNPLAIVQRGAIIYLLATKANSLQHTSKQPSIKSLKELPVIDESFNEHTIEKIKTDIDNIDNAKGDLTDTIRLFTLHRFNTVEVLKITAIIPKDFSLNRYIESGAMGFHEARFDELPKKGKKTKITLTFDKLAGLSILESKLSKKQKVKIDENTVTITAKVNLTRQLVWWLRGFGKSLISAEPELLWQVVKDEI